MTQHTFEEHTNCDKPHCMICDGGLSHCTTCGLFEGSLTTECPGVQCYAEKADDVYAGKLDFLDGEWVERAASPYSPPGARQIAARLNELDALIAAAADDSREEFFAAVAEKDAYLHSLKGIKP